MKCPRDGVLLEKVRFLDLDLDKCHRCDGIWCDRGELERMRDRKIVGVEEAIEKKYGNPKYLERETDGYMQCPKCDGRLRSFNCSYIEPVRIDACDKCYGMWVDKGELHKIIGQKKELDEAFCQGRFAAFIDAVWGLVTGKSGRAKD